MQKTGQDDESLEMLAFIANGLFEIEASVDESVAAWEKRGYWVKADRYRMEWNWAASIARKMEKALLHEEWMDIPSMLIQVGQKLPSVVIPVRHRMGQPWLGAWKLFQEKHPK